MKTWREKDEGVPTHFNQALYMLSNKFYTLSLLSLFYHKTSQFCLSFKSTQTKLKRACLGFHMGFARTGQVVSEKSFENVERQRAAYNDGKRTLAYITNSILEDVAFG